MSMVGKLASLLPQRVQGFLGATKQRVELGLVERTPCDTSPLRRDLDEARLRGILSSPALAAAWDRVAPELSQLFGAGPRGGGVNPGDRRAIFCLVHALAPRSVLEIGTHIGASTIHIAAALRAGGPGARGQLTTVDVIDVNDPVTRPWTRSGSSRAPREMIESIGSGDQTQFVTRPSLEYLAHCGQHYDFIFLDGDHAARTVYREVPAALRALNPGGVILLHDFYPHLRPLWSDGVVIAGPWLATERLRAEGAAFTVLPLGELPWPTKLGSRVTSLAVVTGH
jgi:predicted O-methyltransferase YrrM